MQAGLFDVSLCLKHINEFCDVMKSPYKPTFRNGTQKKPEPLKKNCKEFLGQLEDELDLKINWDI